MTPDPVTPRRGSPWPLLALAIVGLVVVLGAVLGVVLWPRSSTTSPPLAPTSAVILPPPGATPSSLAPDTPSRLAPGAAPPVTGVFIEPGDGRAPLLDEIRAARQSIDLAVYLISDEIILESLEDAQRRGIDVRVILEEHPFGGGGGQDAIFARLEEAGIAVRWGNPVFRFTHLR